MRFLCRVHSDRRDIGTQIDDSVMAGDSINGRSVKRMFWKVLREGSGRYFDREEFNGPFAETDWAWQSRVNFLDVSIQINLGKKQIDALWI